MQPIQEKRRQNVSVDTKPTPYQNSNTLVVGTKLTPYQSSNTLVVGKKPIDL